MDAFDQGGAGDVAKDNAVKAWNGIGVEGFAVFRDDDQSAARSPGSLDEVGHIQLQGSGKQYDGGAEGSNRLHEPVPIHALSNDADIIL